MECNICYEKLDNNKLIMGGCCSFRLCRICYSKLTKKICPVCKIEYPFKDTKEIKEFKELTVPPGIDIPNHYLPLTKIIDINNNNLNLGIPKHYYPKQ